MIMKRHTLLLLLLTSIALQAEDIPAGYYDAIEGLTDSVLKSQLSTIIYGGERYEYGTTTYHSSNHPPEWVKGDLKAYGTWQAFPLTDRREDGSIWDMYTNSVRYYPCKQGESGCSLNIEHCLPKSWWGWNKNDTREGSLLAYRDLWHLNPSDAQANSSKSNYPPGHVVKGDKFDNGSFRMDSKAKSQYGYICFEPAAEYRGDFARAYFYVATAYQNIEWDSTYITTGYITPDLSRFFSEAITQVLLDWHRADPVSTKEICRAEQISSIQHNRNPYIDYPELVEYIWGNKKGVSVSLSDLTCTAGTAYCPEYIPAAPTEHLYDTLLAFPALTKETVNAVPNCFASDKIQSNGTASITMGTSATDGYLAFSSLNLQDTAILTFRASIYNTAETMQLDVYTGNTLLHSIYDTAQLNTRNEIRYQVAIPAGTDSITVVSVGGSTKTRACMQELYLLKAKEVGQSTKYEVPSDKVPSDKVPSDKAEKYLQNGVLYLRHSGNTYDSMGRIIRN